jgi:protein SCO1/2
MPDATTTRPSVRPAILIAALAVACGFAMARLLPPPLSGPTLEWLDPPRAIADFTLTSDHSTYTNEDLHGQWQLLALGFTHCPDVCPTTLTALSTLLAATDVRNLQILFISVDPQRDSAEQLAGYVDFFAENILAATGPQIELHQLARSLGMDFRVDGPVDNPTISHSPTIALIGPDGLLHGRLRPGFDLQQVARELAARLKGGV